ncbi:MAG: ectonucleotide pyrophosphatase/phosphodiesterase [Myxococcota bacterium]
MLRLLLLALLIGPVSATPAAGAPAAAGSRSTVILLSWDGTRWDYPDRGSLPGLERMAREGTRAERLIPVFPTSTFPNHVTLATGAYVERHGIVANSFVDRKRGRYRYAADASWIEAEPIWAAAERQGVRSATYFWVGSESDWHGLRASDRISPFDGSVDEKTKVDQILAWLDRPDARRPRLILSWWHGADEAGHRWGPDSSAVLRALETQDAALQRLLRGLDARDAWPHTTLIVVSDHGMTRVTRRIDLQGALRARGLRAQVEYGGGFGYVALERSERIDEARVLLEALPHLHAWRSDALPAALHARVPGRTGDLTVVADPPFAVLRPPGLGARLLAWLRRILRRPAGMHGYPPDAPDMHAILFALGRGTPRGLRAGPARSLDVAPSIARLLEIDPPSDAQGLPFDWLELDRAAAPGTIPRQP